MRAASAGIDTFTASVLPSNHRMIGVLRDSGYPVQLRSGAGEIAVFLPTSLTPEGRRRFEERERTAAIAAVEHVLRPASIAVVGASRRRGTVGGETCCTTCSPAATPATLYAVNPQRRRGAGACGRMRRSRDLPGPVELAVIAVPAAAVVDVARGCAERAVAAIVVLSAGFARAGRGRCAPTA